MTHCPGTGPSALVFSLTQAMAEQPASLKVNVANIQAQSPIPMVGLLNLGKLSDLTSKGPYSTSLKAASGSVIEDAGHLSVYLRLPFQGPTRSSCVENIIQSFLGNMVVFSEAYARGELYQRNDGNTPPCFSQPKSIVANYWEALSLPTIQAQLLNNGSVTIRRVINGEGANYAVTISIPSVPVSADSVTITFAPTTGF